MYNKLTTTRTDRFFWRSTTIMAIGDLLIGLGFLLGLPTSSPSYTIALSLMPANHWGIFAALAGILFLCGLRKRRRLLILSGLTLGSFYINVFAITFILAAFTGTLAGFTAIIFWGVAGLLHVIATISLPSGIQIKRLENTDATRNHTN